MTASFSYNISGLPVTDVVRAEYFSNVEAAGLAAPVGRDLQLSITTGELELLNGDLQIVSGLGGIRQEITQRVSFFEEDWFLDLQAGLPYFDEILEKLTDLKIIERLYRDEIEATPGVKSVKEMSLRLDQSTRTLYIDFVADSDLGELVVSNFPTV